MDAVSDTPNAAAKSDRAGPRAIGVALSRTCEVSCRPDGPDPENDFGVRVFEGPIRLTLWLAQAPACVERS